MDSLVNDANTTSCATKRWVKFLSNLKAYVKIITKFLQANLGDL